MNRLDRQFVRAMVDAVLDGRMPAELARDLFDPEFPRDVHPCDRPNPTAPAVGSRNPVVGLSQKDQHRIWS